MSLIDVTIGIVVGILLTITFIIIRNQASQKAVATRGSQIKQTQAGRNALDIGTYKHTQTQITQTPNLFLTEGEELATAKDFADFRSQIEQQWQSAQKYIYGVSLYGRPFMPNEVQLEEIVRRGVEIKMILIDPDCPATKDIVEDKAIFSRAIHQQEIFAQTVRIGSLDPTLLLERIHEEVIATIELLRLVQTRYLMAEIGIRLIDFLPVWKGTIVDGKNAVYLIYDVPRTDVPFRWSENEELIKYYEDRYFHQFWKQGREVSVSHV